MVTPPLLPTRLTSRFAARHPFVSAGMAFIATPPGLAVAVTRAGGIGALSVGPLPPDATRALIRAVRAATGGPFHVNFITPLVDEEHVAVCVEEQVTAASFHWGHPPRAWIEALRQGGVSAWEQVGSVDAARRAVDDGVELVVAQGSEAGGHNFGTLPTFVLVPEVVDAVAPALVLAAGGVGDGRQVAAALALGADGVWVGTRLVASREANAHPGYKERLVQATGTDTRLTSLFGPEMPAFNPARVLDNRVLHAFAGREHEIPADPAARPRIGKTSLLGQEMPLPRFTNIPPTPTTEGDLDEMPLLAGQGVGQVRDILPAGEIVARMMADAARILGRLAPGAAAVP